MKPNPLVTKLIYDLEMSLLNPSSRKSSDHLKKVISDEFIEYGSSGLIYNKNDLLKSLPKEKPRYYVVTDFNVRELSFNVVLATYKVMVNSKHSLRSSIWQRQSCDWQMIFHQGTPLPE